MSYTNSIDIYVSCLPGINFVLSRIRYAELNLMVAPGNGREPLFQRKSSVQFSVYFSLAKHFQRLIIIFYSQHPTNTLLSGVIRYRADFIVSIRILKLVQIRGYSLLHPEINRKSLKFLVLLHSQRRKNASFSLQRSVNLKLLVHYSCIAVFFDQCAP